MDSTLVAAVVGVVALVLGVFLGAKLQDRSEARRYLLDASAMVIATALEAVTHMQLDEVQKGGGPVAPELRPDFMSDQYYAGARVRIASTSVAKEAAKVGDAVTSAIGDAASKDPIVREAGRKKVLAAIAAFQLVLDERSLTWWDRLSGRRGL